MPKEGSHDARQKGALSLFSYATTTPFRHTLSLGCRWSDLNNLSPSCLNCRGHVNTGHTWCTCRPNPLACLRHRHQTGQGIFCGPHHWAVRHQTSSFYHGYRYQAVTAACSRNISMGRRLLLCVERMSNHPRPFRNLTHNYGSASHR